LRRVAVNGRLGRPDDAVDPRHASQHPPAVDRPRKRNVRKIVAEQFERLLEKAPNEHWRLLLLLAWYTGMRRCEMLDFTWDNEKMPRVDLRQRRIWLPAAYNKSDEDQWLPIHPELLDVLNAVEDPRAGYLFPFHHVPPRGIKEVHETGAVRRPQHQSARP